VTVSVALRSKSHRRRILEGFLQAYSDDFTRGDGALGGQWTGDTWTIASNKAVNTPSLGPERVADGDMEAAGKWTDIGSPTVNEKSTEQAHGGSQSTKIVADAGGCYRSVTATTGDYVHCEAWGYISAGTGGYSYAGGAHSYQPGGAWYKSTWTGRYTGNSTFVALWRQGGTLTGYVDDVSAKVITIAEMFATLPRAKTDVDIQVLPTIPAYCYPMAGVVVNMDDPTSPQSFVLAYHDRGWLRLVKYVNGTRSQVYAGPQTYNSSKVVRVVKTGTNYDLYYGASLIGSYTISDSEIISNRYHGMFCSHPDVTLDDFAMT
jgi:hypothetical protein